MSVDLRRGDTLPDLQRRFAATAEHLVGDVVVIARGFLQRILLLDFEPDRHPPRAFGFLDLVYRVVGDQAVPLRPFHL